MVYTKQHFEVMQFLQGIGTERKCANETCPEKGGAEGDGILTLRHSRREEVEVTWHCSPVCQAAGTIVGLATGEGWDRAEILDHLTDAIARTPDTDAVVTELEFPPVNAHAMKVGAGVRLGLSPDTKPAA